MLIAPGSSTMRQILIPLSVCFAFAACADRSGNIANPQDQVPTQGPGDTSNPAVPDQTVPPNVTDSGSGGGGTDPGGGFPGDGTDGTDGTDGGQPVPEPSTLLLVGSGLAAAAMLRRRRRAAS